MLPCFEAVIAASLLGPNCDVEIANKKTDRWRQSKEEKKKQNQITRFAFSYLLVVEFLGLPRLEELQQVPQRSLIVVSERIPWTVPVPGHHTTRQGGRQEEEEEEEGESRRKELEVEEKMRGERGRRKQTRGDEERGEKRRNE